MIIRQPERVEARYEIENTGQEATERGRHAHMRAVRRARRGLCGIHDDRSRMRLASETGNPASVKGKTYKIGTDTTFAPFEYRENGKMTGIDMELIRGIAKEEGFKVEIQSLGFNAALQALSSNQVDVVIAGMSITDERKASYDFSNPYFQSGIQMGRRGQQRRRHRL